MAPETLFYRLADLSKRWGRPVDDLLQWGTTGEFTIFVFLDNVLIAPDNLELWADIKTARRVSHAYGKVLKNDIEILLHSKSETIDLFCFYVYQDEGCSASVKWDQTFKTYEAEFITFYRDDLLIATSEASRIEAKHPDLLKQSKVEPFVKDPRTEVRAEKRIERTDLKIIAALVTILKGETGFESQEKIIEVITNRYEKIPDLSERTLEGRFSDGNKALEAAINDLKEAISD